MSILKDVYIFNNFDFLEEEEADLENYNELNDFSKETLNLLNKILKEEEEERKKREKEEDIKVA